MIDLSIGFLLSYNEGSHINEDLLLVNNIADMPLPNEPGKVDCLFLGMCTSGIGKYTLNTVEYVLQPRDLLIVNPGEVTDNYEWSTDFKGVGIIMSRDFYREVVSNIHELSSLFLFARNHPVCELEIDEVDTVGKYFSIIKQKLDNVDHHFREETVKLLLQALIFDLSNAIFRIQQYDKHIPTRMEKIFFDYVKMVEANFRSERRVNWYAKQMNITPKYLLEAVKTISHQTPNEWIDYYMVQELRVALKNSVKSIKEIAAELNFPNQSFMGKYFKDHVGVSPSAYRKR